MNDRKVIRAFIPLVVFSVFSSIVHPVTPAFLESLNVNDYMFGVAFACMATSTFLFAPFFGKLSDQMGRTKIMAFGFMMYAFGQFLFSSATGQLSICIARFTAGLGSAATSATPLAFLTDSSKLEDRGHNLVLAGAITTIGGSFGYLIGGVLGDKIGIKPVFYIQICIVLTLALFTFFLKEERERKSVAWLDTIVTSNPLSVFKNGRDILKGDLLRFFISALLTMLAATCFDQCYNYYFREALGFPTSYNGYIKAAIGILGMAANGIIGVRISRKKDLKKSYFVIVLLCSIFLATTVIPKSIPLFLVLSLSYYTVYSLEVPLQQAILAREEGDDGILFGFFQSFRSIGNVVGALGAGFLYEVMNTLPFIVAAIISASALLFIPIKNKKI